MTDEPQEEEQVAAEEQQPSPPEVAAPATTYEERMWGGRLRFWQCLRCAYDTTVEVEMIHHAEVGCTQHWAEMETAADRKERSN